MYWYYKYSFYAIAILILFGIGYLVWTHLPDEVFARLKPEKTPVVAQVDAPKTKGLATASSPLAPASTSVVASKPITARPVAPFTNDEITRRLEGAEDQLAKDNLVAARTLAQKVLDNSAVRMFDASWLRAVEVVSQANTGLINSNAPAPEKIAYVVKRGDNLIRIANNHHTTVGALQRLNNLNPSDPVIYPGNVLYLYNSDLSILVHKSKFALLLLDGDRIFKVYRVGIGRQNRTPVGVFKITSKVREPAWTPPGKNIPYGNPENVLGTHWLGLKPIEGTDSTLRGYGIHGTWSPETVGTASSQGCVRMLNEEVGELFDLVPMGTRVVIKDE